MDNPVDNVENQAAGQDLLLVEERTWSLGIFVKDPVPGQVKTRMVPPLTPEEAAGLYRMALQETIENACSGPFRVVLFHDGGKDFFRNTFPELPLLPQKGKTLGERMTNALAMLLTEGCAAAGLIGSDSPDLPVALLTKAFATLEQSDAVTIPARDGGYVFVGTSRPCPQLFTEIPWSTSEVRQATHSRAERAALRYREIGEWEDIDDVASLQSLCERSPASATVQYALSNLAIWKTV